MIDDKETRYLLSACILAACTCLALGVLAMVPPRPGVTRANFDRIEEGMTLAEIKAILGEPDGGVWGILGRAATTCQWFHADGACVSVLMEDSKVTDKRFRSSTETIPDKLRRWLHLPK